MKNQVLASHCKPLLLLGIFAIALSACSGSDDDTDLSNSAPSVSAGEDQTVNQGATVNLTGVASDSDGSISSWLWQQTSGSPSVTIKNSTTSNASFAAPEVDAETTLVFELEVKDNDGASVSDSMRVTVRGSGDSVNPLPSDFKAEAGDGQVTLTWSHYSSATDYNIYRSSASDCQLANYTSCANGALFTGKPSPFTDTGLTNGTTYHYWIEAILEGVTYLDNEAISAIPEVEEDDDDGFNIDEDDYQTIYTHSDGTIYAVTKETMNWDDARAMAQAQGGDLVTIHSEAENELVAELLDGETAWLGASDDGDRIPGAFDTYYNDSEDGWRWVDSSVLSYENWNSGEPNNSDPSGAEDCLHMRNNNENWNDHSCSNDDSHHAVFEFSPNDINEDDYQIIYTHSNGTIYAVTKETMTWDDARAMAQDQGGDLVTIHSAEENELVAELLDGESAWLGASDDGDRISGAFDTHYTDSEDGWRWVDGSMLSYENWNSGEPNNSDPSGAEDCMHMRNSNENWNDHSCANDDSHHAVFEFSPVNLFDGLVAHYEFEGNADDSSGNGNDGTEHGEVSYTDGVIGRAASFDGVDDFIELNEDMSSEYLGLSVWFNTDSTKAGQDYALQIIRLRYSGYGVKLNSPDVGMLSVNVALSASENLLFESDNTSFNDGNWYHLVVNYSDVGLRVYIDNSLIYAYSSMNSQPIYHNPDGGYSIGKDGNHWTDYFEGSIDDFRIYNRALSIEEIQTLYELGED